MRSILHVVIGICTPFFIIGQTFDYYIDHQTSNTEAQIFASGIVSITDRSEFGSVFSEDNREFYFAIDENGKTEILEMHIENGQWSSPKVIITHHQYGYNDPMLSPDGNRLYYISNQPKTDRKGMDYDIWFSKRTRNGWSPPINAGPMINSKHDEYYISFTEDGDMYYSSNRDASFDIYKSKFKNNEFQIPKKLGPQVNTNGYEADVYISPDENHLVYCARRQDGKGRGDLYYHHKLPDGTWSESLPIHSVNTNNHELCPWISHDGKFLYYTSNQDIYRILTETFKK